ncbi:MAG: MFS transporter [Candidatus Micrarchaeia archaeon]
MYKINLYVNQELKNFHLIVINSGFSRFGFSTFNLIIIWVILYMTKTPVLSGLGDGFLSVPLFFSFIVGAYVDRFNKKKILAILAGVIRSLSIIMIFIGIFLNNTLITLISIYISAFLIGFTSDIINSIRASWTKEFLNEENYKRGTSFSNIVYSFAEGIGYIASGILISFGSFFAFFTIFFVFSISVIPVIYIKSKNNNPMVDVQIFGLIKEGFMFIKNNKAIWQIMIISFIANLIFGMAGINFVTLVQLHYKLPGIYVSIIFAVLVFGIVFGSSIGRKIKGKLGRISIICFFIIGISLISIYFIPNIYLILIPATIIGLIIGIIDIAIGVTILKIIPQEMIARVQGTFNTFSVGIISFSGLIGGAGIQVIGVLNFFILMGAILIIILPMFFNFKEFYSINI